MDNQRLINVSKNPPAYTLEDGKARRDYQLSIDDLLQWESINGRIHPGLCIGFARALMRQSIGRSV